MSSSTFQGETSIIWRALHDRKMGSGQGMELYSVAYTALREECEPNTTTVGVNGVETLSQALVQEA